MAAQFTDAAGKTWSVRFTIGLLPKLRAEGLDLSKSLEEMQTAISDPERFGRILWVLCERQAREVGVTEEQFADAFDGPTIFAAVSALGVALADFTHPPAVAAAARDLIAKREAESQAKQIQTLKATVGNSPGSAGSTPES